MADFDPRELDQLEDLLEGLTAGAADPLDEALDELELSPAVVERLAGYRDVLALCRDAYPIETPRDDLLVDVLAEAHAVTRRPQLREPDGGRWRRTWERWRGTLIPGLALAGTAAAVLLLLDPDRNLEHGDELLTDNRPSERPEADTTPSEPASEPNIDDDAESRRDPSPSPSEPGAGASDPSPQPGTNADALGTKPSDKPLAKRSAGKPTAASPAAPMPKPEPLSKDDTWTTLERANTDRRKGDCDRARTRYEQVIAASSDTLAVARAKAGVGLCLEQDRRTSEADQWFADARSSNAGIDAWIETQRDDQPAPGETKSKSMPAEADALLDSL